MEGRHSHQGSSSHPVTAQDHETNSPRVSIVSPRISGIDYHVADGFHPDISPAVSPGPGDQRSSLSTRAVAGPSNIRTSMLKESSDDSIAGSSHQHFDPNTSRFNRPPSSASTSAESPNTYRDRISRISFSYPRRSPSSAGQNGSNVNAAHPYALYRQTTFEEADEAENITQPLPVGFYGRPNASFRRRTGPDGEDLDVVGPDGHLEQLPPYTRYPTAGPIMNKSANEPPSPISSVGPSNTSSPIVAFSTHSATSSPILPFQGTSTQASPLIRQESIPLTPMTPIVAQQSLQNLPSAQNLQGVQGVQGYPEPILLRSNPNPNPDAGSRGSGNSRALQSSASSLVEAKPDEDSLKKKKKKQKLVCGVIPLWALLLVAFIGIFLAIIAGGVIGGLLSQQKGKQKEAKDPTVTVTSTNPMWDAALIPAPTNVASLPTGQFFFPLGAAEEQQRSCLESGKDSIAWACNVLPTNLLISFSRSSSYFTAKIQSPPMPNNPDGIPYGPQPPRVQPPQKMVWVTDLADPSKGPALHFQTVYDKIVILESDMFPTGHPRMGQQIYERSNDNVTAKIPLNKRHDPSGHALANSPGETPWYCYWNSTFIEGFIYVNQTVPGAETQNFQAYTASRDAMPIPASMTTHIRPMIATTETSKSTGHSHGQQLPMRRGVSPNTAIISPSPAIATPAPTLPQAAPEPELSSLPVPLNVERVVDSGNNKFDTGTSPGRFPFIIKIEERRLPNPAFQPFCQQMRVNPLGVTEPLLDAGGNPRIERLREAAGQKTDAQVTAGAGGHQTRGGIGDSDPGHFDDAGGWSKRRVRRGKLVKSVEYGMDENGQVKLLTKRRDEPGNSCHCQWISPYN